MQGLKRLSVISKLNQKNPNWVHKDIFRILNKKDIWYAAYENIKGNKDALTPGVTTDTLDRVSLSKIHSLQLSVLNESYKFQPVKQIWIPKAKGKRRPLGLPTPNDKLVQEVIRMILEAIYEPNFDKRSFGFRSGIGVHNALQYVEKEFRWVDWVITGDIQNAYPTIDPNILCEIISRKIRDVRFMNLIRKSLKGGVYVNPETVYSKLGVPQGSIVFPILANIYYDELDKFISQKEVKVYSPKSTLRHPKYKQFEYQIKKVSQQLDQTERNSKDHDNLKRKIKNLIQQQIQTPSLLDQGIELKYVRYADDWMIGIKGPRNLTIQIKKDVEEFFCTQLKQKLDPDKTKIIDLRAGKVLFLGYELFLPRNSKLVKYKKLNGKQTIRRSPPILRFQLPVDLILKRLKERGYIAILNNKIRPISKGSYTVLEDEVIVKHFRSVWLGLLNFYSGTTNWSHLQYIHYLLHMSCAMTLAHRHRSSSRKIFEKHGKELKIMDSKAKTPKVIASFPYRSSWKVGDRKWHLAVGWKDPFTIFANRVSRSRLNKPCLVCKTNITIEMHHVKHVRKNGHRYEGFHAEMALLNRKQVPLCKDCHLAVHRGEYNGIKLFIPD